jgi:hypothetical protein
VRQLFLPDKMQRKLGPAAASELIGNQDVNLRILPAAHVVHEVDLRPHKVEIAEVAIEEYAEPARW